MKRIISGYPPECTEVCSDSGRQPDHTRRIAATTRPMMLILSILRSQAS